MTYPPPPSEPPIDPWQTTGRVPPVPAPPPGLHPPMSALPAPPRSPGPLPPAYAMPVPVVFQQTPTTGLATASLVLGILGVVFGCCTFGAFSLAGVICGHMALREIHRTGVRGHTAAVWGLLLSYPMVALGLVGTIGVIIDRV